MSMDKKVLVAGAGISGMQTAVGKGTAGDFI